MRKSVALSSAVILGMLVAGCSSSGTTSQPQTQQPSQVQTQPSNPSQQRDLYGLISVTYSDAQINQILQLAKQDKIQMPYVPTKIMDGDEFESAVGYLTLKYKKMIINESEQAGGGGVIVQHENVLLSNGVTAQWIQIQGKASSSFWVLYLKQGNTYITIQTDGTRNKLIESIAESLTPLKDQTQP